MLDNSFTAWINAILACMGSSYGGVVDSFSIELLEVSRKHILESQLVGCRGCLGSYTEPTKFFPIHGSRGLLSVSDGFWTSSAYDMDVGGALSQRHHSSLTGSAQNLPLDLSGSKATNSHVEFTNYGLEQWNQTRVQWGGGKKRSNRSHKTRERTISIYATYDSLLGTKQAFRKPIPLAEMVDFLVDVWDEEGLYD